MFTPSCGCDLHGRPKEKQAGRVTGVKLHGVHVKLTILPIAPFTCPTYENAATRARTMRRNLKEVEPLLKKLD